MGWLAALCSLNWWSLSGPRPLLGLCLFLFAYAAASPALSMAGTSYTFYDTRASADFVFSDAFVGSTELELANLHIAAIPPSSTIIKDDDAMGDATGTPYQPYEAGAHMAGFNPDVDGSGALIGLYTLLGVNLNQSPSLDATGGYINITNLSYDAASNSIWGDVSGRNLAGTYVLPIVYEQVFSVHTLEYSGDGGVTWTTIANPSDFVYPRPALDGSSPAFELRAGGLTLEGGSVGIVYIQIEESLGLKGVALNTLAGINGLSTNPAGYGSLTCAVVPEPSTSAMVALSLLGLTYRPLRRARGRAYGNDKSSV